MVKLVDVAARAREMRNVREEKRGRGRVGYRGCRGPQRVGGALAALLSLLPFPVSLFFSRSFSLSPSFTGFLFRMLELSQFATNMAWYVLNHHNPCLKYYLEAFFLEYSGQENGHIW